MKSLEELKNELATAYSNKWRTDAYNFFAYDAFKQGFDAAIKAVSEKYIKDLSHIKSGLYNLKERDLGALGLYEYIREALKDYRGMK